MKPTQQLVNLVDKRLSNHISRVEMAQLEELLKCDDALQYYLEIAGIEGDLPLALASAEKITVTQASKAAFRCWSWWITTAAAAAIFFFIGLYSGKRVDFHPSANHVTNTQSGERPIGSGAVITSLMGVTWEGSTPDFIKIPNNGETISIKSGLIQLTFDSGVRSIIEGPASIKVTGGNSAEFFKGRLVADVPKGAEGFTVVYPDGKVVDLGTEFAMNVPQDQKGAEVGVFRGEVQVYDKNQNKPLMLVENEAVVQTFGSISPFASIPFERENFIRELPSREFPWALPTEPSPNPSLFEFDVSHLVWKSGTYRAIFKYMKGVDALVITEAQLLRDGMIIASDKHFGRTGLFERTVDNIFTFSISENQYKKGKWTLRVTAKPDAKGRPPLGTFSPDSSGILLFEEG